MIVVNEHFSSWAKFSAWLEDVDPQVYGWIAVALILAFVFLTTRFPTGNRRPGYTYHRDAPRSYRSNSFHSRNRRPETGERPIELDRSRPLPTSGAKSNDDFLIMASNSTHAKPVESPSAMANPVTLVPKPITLVQQMEAVSAVKFETVPLLNREEAKLLPLLESLVRSHGDGHRVMAQTSLGELIRPRDDMATTGLRSAAHASVNSKRLDFAIINRWGHLVLAIEYQGSGHYIRDTAFQYDAVKKEAIRKANVDFYEVPSNYTPEDVARRVRAVLVLKRTDPPEPPKSPIGGGRNLN